MSKFNIGDKVNLECEISEYDESDNTYCIAYSDYNKFPQTSCWVKDDVLHSTDEAYNKGLNDAWELAKKIILPSHMSGYTMDEFKNIFGKNTYISALRDFTPQEALAKAKAYEECNEIKVRDVVKVKGSELEGIVTKVMGRVVYRLFKDGSCDGRADKEDLVKTGKHFDSIDEFMKQED